MKTTILLLLLSFAAAALFSLTETEAYQQVYKAYTEARYADAAKLINQYLSEAGETDGWLYYLACVQALNGDKEQAFGALERSIGLGWSDLKTMREDKDLALLHDDARWEALLARAQANTDAILAALPETHARADSILLPPPELTGEVSVEQALQQRRSVREYAPGPLTLREVSQILWAAYGVTRELAPTKLRGGFKTAPSAGATYPLEVYLAAWEVEGLAPGIYLYEPWGHKLFAVRKGDLREELFAASYGQDWVRDAPASLVYSAVFSRTTDRYGERGRERYVCMDLGHSGENVYLQAEALGLGTVAIGAFDDLKLRLAVGMARAEEPLYIMPFGRKVPESGDKR
jgi:SagB-type dehydrogenase family enzyme